MWRTGRRVWNEKMSEHLEIRIIEEAPEKPERKAEIVMSDECEEMKGGSSI